MIPILYKANLNTSEEKIGYLTDAITCVVPEERNGAFELEMQYPNEGILREQIAVDGVIKAKPNDRSEPQYFRIYSVSKPINKIITVNAEHISYELNGVPAESLAYTGNASAVLNELLAHTVVPHNFTARSDISSVGTIEVKTPCSVRSTLGGREGSVLDCFGGEYEFDNREIILHARRGRDTDVLIEYGKNLTDIVHDTDISDAINGIMPYAVKTDGETEETVTLAEKVIYSESANYNGPKVTTMDFTQMFEEGEEITEEALREKAQEYIQKNAISAPSTNIKVTFTPLWQSEEYAQYRALERVGLCDTVIVRYPELDIDARAKVIKTTFDVLKEQYVELELGDARPNFADTINGMREGINDIPKQTKSIVQAAVDNATELITGAKGGHVVFKLDAGGKPQEILIMDTDDINTALKVWRWNMGGFGYSSHGVNGPYGTAITMDGQIVGSYIVALEIVGNQITAGNIKSPTNPNVFFNLDTGELVAGKMVSTDGKYKVVSEGQEALKIYENNNLLFSISAFVDEETGESKTKLSTKGQDILISDTTISFVTSLFGEDKKTNLELYPHGDAISTNLTIYPTGDSGGGESLFIAPDGIFIRNLPIYYNGTQIYPKE